MTAGDGCDAAAQQIEAWRARFADKTLHTPLSVTEKPAAQRSPMHSAARPSAWTAPLTPPKLATLGG